MKLYTSLRVLTHTLSLAPLTHALADFSCICEPANLNGCSRSYSCRLNSTIELYNTAVPAWVADPEEALFVNTIDDAVNGLLSPPFLSLGRMTWEAAVACDDDEGELRWNHQLTQCGSTTIASGNVTTQRRRYHGWASLGFHPLGNQPGTWLTQILGEISEPDDTGDGHLARATCASTGLYVSVDYINATRPYDPRFGPPGHWGMLYLSGPDDVYPVGAVGVPSYRTDGDLIENGVDLNCTGYDTTGRVCAEPECVEPVNVTHYECPAGQGMGGVSAANCSRKYGAADENVAASEGVGLRGMGGHFGTAGLLFLGLGLAV